MERHFEEDLKTQRMGYLQVLIPHDYKSENLCK
jgi:hypothetical protein